MYQNNVLNSQKAKKKRKEKIEDVDSAEECKFLILHFFDQARLHTAKSPAYLYALPMRNSHCCKLATARLISRQPRTVRAARFSGLCGVCCCNHTNVLELRMLTMSAHRHAPPPYVTVTRVEARPFGSLKHMPLPYEKEVHIISRLVQIKRELSSSIIKGSQP
jgi:hypothetical protein